MKKIVAQKKGRVFVPKTTIFEDRDGKKEKTVFQNKVFEEVLGKPSQWYINNVLKPDQETSRIRTEKVEKEMKIARKMREIAIRELEKEEAKK